MFFFFIIIVIANFVCHGSAIGTVLIQGLICLILLLITAIWSYNDMKKKAFENEQRIESGIETNLHSLKQSTKKTSLLPVYPYGIAILKCFVFFVGIIGCIIELLYYYGFISNINNINWFNQNLDLILVIFISFFAAFLAYLWYICHFRRNEFNLVYPTKNIKVINWQNEIENAKTEQIKSMVQVIKQKSVKLLSNIVEIYENWNNNDNNDDNINMYRWIDDNSHGEKWILLDIDNYQWKLEL